MIHNPPAESCDQLEATPKQPLEGVITGYQSSFLRIIIDDKMIYQS